MPDKDFAPHSHFFTDPSAFTQSGAQAFGPVSENEFRLTSGFAISFTGTKAFAICTGTIFIQPQSGSVGKVNVILRPYNQPVQGFNIRYFVYRGLQLSDFFDGANVKAASPTASDFINKINSVFSEFYASTEPGQSAPAFLAKYIGYEPENQTDLTALLDKFFFKQSDYIESNGQVSESQETAFELPIIEVGKSLGTFASGDCGVDIVLNYGDYQLPAPYDEFIFDLSYARLPEAKIILPVGIDAFNAKRKKEQIYQFLDAAAYYGYHGSWEKGVVTTDNGGVKEHKKGMDIYTAVVEQFVTKNRLYLYIQSDRTRSYNFYENYAIQENSTNSLKVGATDTTLTEISFETTGWPLLIDDAPQAHSLDNNKLHLQLVTDNNVNAMFYGQVGQVDNAQTDNFINADNLLLPVDQNGEPSMFTKIITLSNRATGPNNAKVYMASFNLLIYQGRTYSFVSGQDLDNQGVMIDVLAVPNFFDDVFDNINAEPSLKASNDTDYSRITSQKLKLINHYDDRSQQGISVVQTAIINDVIETGLTTAPTLDRVTYLTEAVDVLNNIISVSGTITHDTKSAPSVSGSVTSDKTYRLPEPFYYELIFFTDSTQAINGLELRTVDRSIPNRIVLGLTKVENDLLKALITTNDITNARVFLVDLFEEGNELISTENILYQKYKAGIVGEKPDGTVELYLTEPEILVYSLDRLAHFSKGYSEFVKIEEKPVSSLSLDLDIVI